MVSYKGKQMLMMDSEIPLVVYLAKKDEYICPPKDLYTNVSNGTIHTCQKLKQTKCLSAAEWLKKIWYIHTIKYKSALLKGMNYQACNYIN